VNDCFEFATMVNLANYLVEETHLSYELKGVVLHSGNAEGSHYTSLVFIDEKWREFNDNEVLKLPEVQFAERCFGKVPNPSIGKNFNPGTSASLLFYMK
jgi:hypothetical protein